MTRPQSPSLDLIKSKMPLLQLLPCVPPRSPSTNRRLRMDLPTLNGLRVSNVGTNERSSTARIMQGPHVLLPKHGAKSLATSGLHSFWQFSLTKICVESVKPSHQSAIMSCCQGSAVDAQLRRRISRECSRPLLRHSFTPSRRRLMTRSQRLNCNPHQF